MPRWFAGGYQVCGDLLSYYYGLDAFCTFHGKNAELPSH